MKIGINVRCVQKNQVGLANYTINLLVNLLEISKGEEFYLFSPRQDNFLSLNDVPRAAINGEKFKEIISWPITLRSGSIFGQSLKAFWEKVYLTHELNKHQVDLFHDPTFSIPFNFNKFKVVTVHDLSFLKFPDAFPTRTYLYHKLFLKNVVERADIVIAVSESVKRDIVEFYSVSEKKVRVIYEGVNELFYKQNNDEENNHKICRLVKGVPFLLSVSAMNPRKNISNIIKAFGLLKDQYKDLFLVLVGRMAWGCEEIKKTVNELCLGDRVVFAGYVDDRTLCHLYNKAEVFLYPSLYEGFGLPLLEAMACGVPIVTSNLSSMPEIVGEAGMLVNPFDYREIAETVDSILSDRRLSGELIRMGKERVKEFSWRKAAEQTIEIYKSLN